jgi:proline iminopeptidase
MRVFKLLFLTVVVAACDTMSPSEPGNLVPQTVAENPSLPSFDMNGARFHGETFGSPSKPVIIFLHGGPGGDYRGLLRLKDRHNGYSLADEYFLVFWDQRGSGLSERRNKRELTRDVFTADLDSLIKRYSPQQPVYLIGESWGGMYATMYINAHPQRVAGAVLIEPGPLTGATAERIADDMFDLDPRREWLNDYAWSSQFLTADDHQRMDFEMFLGARESQPKFGLSKTDESPSWRLGAAVNKYLAEDGMENGKYTYDFTNNLSAYDTPVQFIAGAMSQVLGPSLQNEQVQHYSSASLKVFEGAGHDVAWVKAGDVVAQIRTYLNARKGGN